MGLGRFGDLAVALEQAAGAIARLDALLANHQLASAWAWRSRLDAVRRQAAADGLAIDPWHLAAVTEDVRFRMDPRQAIIDRGAILEAARYAFALWRWFVRPDDAQTAAIERATAALPESESASPLLAAAVAVHAWLDRHGRNDQPLWGGQGNERPALRAALALYWQRCNLMPVAAPLLTGATAFCRDAPRQAEPWVAQFLLALADEAQAGLALLRMLEQQWFAGRLAVRGRRSDSHAAAAVDVMAAAPLVSATSLGASLGIAVKNAAALLDSFVTRGIAIEVTHRSKRRLFGLKHLAPLREEALPPRRVRRAGGVARSGTAGWPDGAYPDIEDADGGNAAPRRWTPALSPLERQEFKFSDLDEWMREAERVIRRSQAILESLTPQARSATARDTA